MVFKRTSIFCHTAYRPASFEEGCLKLDNVGLTKQINTLMAMYYCKMRNTPETVTTKGAFK